MKDDARAWRILFDTYWSAAGWRTTPPRLPTTSPTQRPRATCSTLDPRPYEHDAALRRAPPYATDLSSTSSSTRSSRACRLVALERRSALGSFAALCNFVRHDFRGSGARCLHCGGHHREPEQDVNVFNFERYK
jgi:hypothetical protein